MRFAISALLPLALAACGGGGGGSDGPPSPVLLHSATVGTLDGAGTLLSHPLLDGNPYAQLMVTHVLNPEGALVSVKDPHPIGVRYIEFRGRWEIFNEDNVYMPAGASFFVQVMESGESFVHLAIPEETHGNVTDLSHARINGNPDAHLIVTQYAGSPDSVLYVTNPANIGVYYTYATGVWHVFNQDGSAIPFGSQFFVLVQTRPRGAYTHDAAAASIGGPAGQWTRLDFPDLDGNPMVHLHVTPHWNPPGETAVYDDHPPAAFYVSATGHWAVAHADDAPMPLGASFNVWMP